MGGKLFKQDEIDLILKLHTEGYNNVEIGNIVNRNDTSIGRILKQNNKQSNYSLSKLEIDNIIKLYKDGLTCKEIYGTYFKTKFCYKTIERIITNNNIGRKGGYKNNLNHDYFENIDTEIKAYFLGLITADGNVMKMDNRSDIFQIGLKGSDKYMLDILKTELKCDNKIVFDNRNKYTEGFYNFRCSSNKIVEDLNKYNIKPNKTLNICEIPSIDNNLIRHFIRGYFDGDGTVYMYKKTRLRFAFYGTELFLNNLKNVLINEITMSDSKITNQKKYNVSLLPYSSNSDIINFYNYIYKNSTIFINRKKDMFDTYVQKLLNQ